MRSKTVVVSLLVHAGLAVFLLSRAETRQKRRAIAVAVTGTDKKKEEDKPKPPPPKPPPPRKPQAPKPSATPKAPDPEPVAARAPKAAAAPVQTAVAMSNADLAPGGIALPGTPKGEPQAKPVRVAQAVPEEVKRRLKESKGNEEENCDEEPSKPEPVFKNEIEYTAAAREQGIEGKLKLRITVAADGSVSDVEVIAGLDPSLDAAAIAAAKQWRFKPAQKCGKAVGGGVYVVAQRFELAN